jgi:hypothetical protein
MDLKCVELRHAERRSTHLKNLFDSLCKDTFTELNTPVKLPLSERNLSTLCATFAKSLKHAKDFNCRR